MDILEVYLDESCKDGHRYLAIGGIAIERGSTLRVLGEFGAVRATRSAWSEVKWTRLRSSRLHFYRSFIDVFFNRAKSDDLHYHCLYVDTTTADHKTFSDGSTDIGFDRLMYQLLLHKFGRPYGSNHILHVYIDKRISIQDPAVLRPMLNNVLANRYGIITKPFRHVQFLDSSGPDTDLLQTADLLTSCIATRKNGHHKQPGAAAQKIELGDHIARSAYWLEFPRRLEGWPRAKRFTIWPFKYMVK